MKARWTLTTLLALSVLIISLALQWGAAAQATPVTTGSKGEALSSGSDQTSAAAQHVERIAESGRLAPVYGGDIIHPDGTVTVYVTLAGADDMRAALVHGLPPSDQSTFQIQPVAHSWGELEGLTHRIAGDANMWQSHGVTLVKWGPDIATNRVEISVQGYTLAIAQELKSRYGSDRVGVVPYNAINLPQRAVNRYYDFPPFFGGDRIWPNNNRANGCTSGFAIQGNGGAEAIFSTTAGHCYGSRIYTNDTKNYEMGGVATNYFQADPNKDLETFGCDCVGDVWWGDNVYHTVVGNCGTCGVGARITFDGATTGEVPDAEVVQTGICVTFSDGLRTCNLRDAIKEVSPGVFQVVCQGGDSGGPVYLRSSNDDIYAAGVIVGESQPDCFYHDIGWVYAWSNTHIVNG
jgi:hypothetical protein